MPMKCKNLCSPFTWQCCLESLQTQFFDNSYRNLNFGASASTQWKCEKSELLEKAQVQPPGRGRRNTATKLSWISAYIFLQLVICMVDSHHHSNLPWPLYFQGTWMKPEQHYKKIEWGKIYQNPASYKNICTLQVFLNQAFLNVVFLKVTMLWKNPSWIIFFKAGQLCQQWCRLSTIGEAKTNLEQ